MSATSISKSIATADWDRIKRAHVPTSASIVDHQFHTAGTGDHPTVEAAEKHPTRVKPVSRKEVEGISQKLVLDHPKQPGERVMIKPYHKKLEAKASWVTLPITGWATMATKALFNAGGIGHLAEDVQAHEHRGVPVTVHRFAQEYDPAWRYQSLTPPMVDHTNLRQIAVMDYLANNSDRHAANMMIGKYSTPRGYNPVLAIDHERNFQYKSNPTHVRPSAGQPVTTVDLPRHYVGAQAPGIQVLWNKRLDDGHHDLLEWWRHAGPRIRTEMDRQLVAIKDEKVREHIRNNFDKRYRAMNDWANNHPEVDPHERRPEPVGGMVFRGPSTVRPFPAPTDFPGVRNDEFPRKYREAVAKMRPELPFDPLTAANQVMDRMSQPGTAQKKAIMREMVAQLADEMSPRQLVNFMNVHHGSRNANVRQILSQKQWASPDQEAEFRQAVHDLVSSSPAARKRFPFLVQAIAETKEQA